jgi:hypothetical protein
MEMTSDQPTSPGESPPGDNRRRKAPTIELKATEVEGTAAQAAEATPPAGTQSSDGDEQQMQSLRATFSWPALGAGAVGGAIIAQLFLAGSLLITRDGDVSGLDARLARIEATVAAMRPASDAASADRLSTIECDPKALTETVGVLARRSDEVMTAAREARQRADATGAALAELRQKITPGGDVAARDKIEGQLQTLTTRLAAVEGVEKAIETELAKRAGMQNRDRSGRLAAAATALNVAVERGEPFTVELAAVKSLATDPKLVVSLEPFAASGVPSAAALARELAALIPSLLAAAGPPPRGGGFLEKLQANAEKLVRIRPLEEAPGSDPAAIVARIEIRASKGDLAGALAELADLPPAVRAPAGAWIEKAQARAAAVESSRRLATDALAGLSK